MVVPSVGVFGSPLRTSALLAINMMGETHASELSRVLERSLSRVQSAVDSLERAGLIIGIEEGRARRLRLNPRFPALGELVALLDRLGAQDASLQSKLEELRRRPRRAGKAL